MPAAEVGATISTPENGAIFEFIAEGPETQTPLPSFSSYTDYVAELAQSDKQYGWLLSFLKRPGPSPSVTTAYVIDRTSTGVKILGARDAEGLSTLLNRRYDGASETRTRVMVISYPESWSLDRRMLELLAMRYALNPLHLFKHLCHQYSWFDRNCPKTVLRVDLGWTNDPPPVVLPWENLSEFRIPRLGSDDAVAAIRVQRQPEATGQQSRQVGEADELLVFCRSFLERPAATLKSRNLSPRIHPGVNAKQTPEVVGEYLSMIQNLGQEALSSADDSILEYLLPYTRIAEVGFVEVLKELRDKSYFVNNRNDLDDTFLRQYWGRFNRFRDDFRTCYDNLARLPASEVRDKHLADYRYLSEKIDQFGEDITQSMNRKVGLLSLRESQQSIKEAEAVRRLSQLAFVFIPLTFVTSCFGMNLDILGSGYGKLSTFFGVASGITVVVILLPLAYSMSKGIIESSTRPLRVTLMLARYFPGPAFRLLCFGITHPGKLGIFLHQMNLYRSFLGEDFSSGGPVFDPADELDLSPYWRATGSKIFAFFQEPRWERRTA